MVKYIFLFFALTIALYFFIAPINDAQDIIKIYAIYLLCLGISFYIDKIQSIENKSKFTYFFLYLFCVSLLILIIFPIYNLYSTEKFKGGVDSGAYERVYNFLIDYYSKHKKLPRNLSETGAPSYIANPFKIVQYRELKFESSTIEFVNPPIIKIKDLKKNEKIVLVENIKHRFYSQKYIHVGTNYLRWFWISVEDYIKLLEEKE